MGYPIFAGNGRTVIGAADGVRFASLKIRRLIDIPKGFVLHVWLRSGSMADILGLPQGFVYALSYQPAAPGAQKA